MTTTSPTSSGSSAPERLVDDEQLKALNIPVTSVRVATVGGGLGSFALVDRLRVGGVADEDIAVIGSHRKPGAAFVARCTASGLGPDERLRSDSASRIDNLWGFPGYAAEEAWRGRTLKPLGRSLGETVLTEAYSPTVRLLADGLDREASRIGWSRMMLAADAEYVFKRTGGGYFVICQSRGQRIALRCDHVHIALGARGPAFSPEAEALRTDDPEGRSLLHVYEPHDDVIATLARRGGSVMVRGTGIAASRLLQRLAEARRQRGREIHIWQVFPTWPEQPTERPARRTALGFSHQQLEFPKAAYGGQLADEIRRISDEAERIALIEELGATTTPYRKEWAEQLQAARAEGWYDAVVGEVESFTRRGGKVLASVRLQNTEELALAVDHVIDATHLDQRSEGHALVADMLAFSPVAVNSLGGLRTDERYAVSGGASGDGRMYASGVTAAGGHYGPVDSFTGLQQAALVIADDLADAGLGHHLSPWRSLRGWMRWIGGKQL